jgi:hypothetical protein
VKIVMDTVKMGVGWFKFHLAIVGYCNIIDDWDEQ